MRYLVRIRIAIPCQSPIYHKNECNRVINKYLLKIFLSLLKRTMKMSQNEFNSRTKKIFLESKSLWLSQPVYVPLLGTAVAKLYHLGTAGNSFDVAQSSINRHVFLSFSFILNQSAMLKYIFLSSRPLRPGPSWIGAPLPNSYATPARPSKWKGFGL